MTAPRAALHRALALGLAATAAARLGPAALFPTAPRWDGFFYHQHAARLAAGLGYADLGTSRPTAFYPVGYPFALSLPLRLGLSPFAAVVALNLLASLASTAAVVLVAARAPDPRAPARAALAAALYPGLALWSCAAMGETLTAALLVVALALATHPAQRPRHALLAGAALGLAALVRPPSLLALAAVAAAAPAGRRARALALAALAAGAVLAPWAARNALSLDAPALVSTNGGSNALIGTLDDARGGYLRPVTPDDCRHVHGEVARDRCLRDAALARVAAAPLRWAALGVEKLVVTFAWEHDPVSYLRTPYTPLRSDRAALAATAVCTLAWWSLLALAWRRRRAGDPTTRAVAVTVAATAATHFAFLGADRYHLVLAPALMLLATRARSPRGPGETTTALEVPMARRRALKDAATRAAMKPARGLFAIPGQRTGRCGLHRFTRCRDLQGAATGSAAR